MSDLILVNSSEFELRVAYLENEQVVEIYHERLNERGIIGNIYKGKVIRVLPGMQSSFVDIGLERSAFLYVTEVTQEYESGFPFDVEQEDFDINAEPPKNLQDKELNIQNILREGQEILVQVTRAPMGTKGAQLTAHISLPGRYLVYMPTMSHIGISRRIENEETRKQLRKLIEEIRPDKRGGFIVRTASEKATKNELKNDMTYLLSLWERILKRFNTQGAPSLIYEEPELDLRVIRELFSDRVERVIVDDPKRFEKLKKFISQFQTERSSSVELWKEKEPLFEHYGVELEINRALERKVWLKSGGYIVIDETEALTTIDVNTGRFVGKRDFEQTILKTNLEAVKEIVSQLRLRNIGGIIIIDFIDMNSPRHKEKVLKELKKSLKQDKAKTTIVRISEIGLVEMTRKRTVESLSQKLCESCPYCEGKGYLKSKQTIAYNIFRELEKNAEQFKDRNIKLYINPEVAELVLNQEHQIVERLERKIGFKLSVIVDRNFHQEQYEFQIGEYLGQGAKNDT